MKNIDIVVKKLSGTVSIQMAVVLTRNIYVRNERERQFPSFHTATLCRSMQRSSPTTLSSPDANWREGFLLIFVTRFRYSFSLRSNFLTWYQYVFA